MSSSESTPSPVAADVIARLESREAVLGIVGLGYVGLPLACAAGEAGYRVLGFEVDSARVDVVNAGRSPIGSLPTDLVAGHVEAGRLSATTDFARFAEVDAIIICVPTPITLQREPDLSYVVKTAENIAVHLKRGQLIVLESTTWPGTTVEIMRPILERGGLRSGVDFFLAFSPEREDPGNPRYSTHQIPKVVGGDGADALKVACALYKDIVSEIVPVSSTQTAEAVKLTENIFRSVNIALINELKIVFHEMGIDIWEVIDAAKSKPFGYMPFYPGPGLGGHCIPIDPFYLTWKAREFDLATHFIELAGEINSSMPRYVVARLTEELDQRFSKGLNGTKILMLGVAYKKNVGDCRESPAMKLLQLLGERGVDLAYHDPYVPLVRREHDARHGEFDNTDLSPEMLADFDAVVIVTDHDSVDYRQVVDHARLVLDTRNACGVRGITGPNIAKA